MKRIYLDTNILLTLWAPVDPFFHSCIQIRKAIEKKEINALFSGFGLAEVASVVERQKRKFSVKDPVESTLAIEFVKKITLIKNLEIIDDFVTYNIDIQDNMVNISSSHWLCIDVAKNIGLKTLDNLHIASLLSIQNMSGKNVDYFVTNDREILSKANLIKKRYKVSVVASDNLISLEGL
jgi:predicted nucleic acid-binding protein